LSRRDENSVSIETRAAQASSGHEAEISAQGADASAPETGSPPPDPGQLTVRAQPKARACCCPAQPVARAIMPPAPQRAYPVDLLLCGHHYRISRQALIGAGASMHDMPGKADAAAAAPLDVYRAPAAVA
jgi:hypothetical protein